jgi:hypothetical protein
VELNTLESGDIRQVVYAEKNGGAVWQVSFTTPVEEFDQRSPVFDQIARSTNLPFTKEPPLQRSQLDPGVIILIVVIIIIFGLAATAYIRRRQKPEPIQPKKTAKKKKTKK